MITRRSSLLIIIGLLCLRGMGNKKEKGPITSSRLLQSPCAHHHKVETEAWKETLRLPRSEKVH
jgi:hypothetical protein